MSNSKIVFKRNNGGEIRGYNTIEPPKTIPVEETSEATIPMIGAGDAVKSGYANEVGTRSALQMYQDGKEVGESRVDTTINLPEVSIEAETPYWLKDDRLHAEEILGKEREKQAQLQAMVDANIQNKEQKAREKLMQTEEGILKLQYKDDYDPALYKAIKNMEEYDKIKFVPGLGRGLPPEIVAQYTAPGYIYNRIQEDLRKKKEAEEAILKYQDDTLDAILLRDQLRKQYKDLNESNNLFLNQELSELEQEISEVGLKGMDPERRERYFKLSAKMDYGGANSDEERELYDKLYDLDIRLNDPGKYSKYKFTNARQNKQAIENFTGGFDDWLTANIPVIGGMVGESIVSAGDIIKQDGSAQQFWESLSSDEKGSFKKAAAELGIDALNVVALVSIGTGGAGFKALSKGIASGAAKAAIKNGVKVGLKGLKNVIAKNPWYVNALYSLSGGTAATLGAFAVDALKDPSEVDKQLAQVATEIAGGLRYGLSEEQDKLIDKYVRQNFDPTKRYSSKEDFLNNLGFASLADYYRYRGKEVPPALLEEEKAIKAQNILDQEKAEFDNIVFTGEDIPTPPSASKAPETAGTADKEESEPATQKSVVNKVDKPTNIPSKKSTGETLKQASEKYSDEDQRLLELANAARKKFLEEQRENKYYDYLRK